MKNVATPGLSIAAGLAAVDRVGATSSNTPQTAQTAGGPDRLNRVPNIDPTGAAEVDRNGIMPDQGCDATMATKTTYAMRKRLFR